MIFINPEALHWKKAEKDLANLSKKFKELNLDFWKDLDWVGGYFAETLVSFDLIDAVMSLVRDKGQIKYLIISKKHYGIKFSENIWVTKI